MAHRLLNLLVSNPARSRRNAETASMTKKSWEPSDQK
jgi:hypothetical protein